MTGRDAGSRSGLGAWFDRVARRLDRMFKPFVGGAQVSPYVDPPVSAKPEWVCPTCHQPLSAHQMDASARGRMYCPAPPLEAADRSA